MCFSVNFSFNHSNGSFSLQIRPLHFVLSSSFLIRRARAHFPQRALKLGSTVATNSRVTVVVRAAAFPCPQPDPSHGNSSSDENLEGEGRAQKQQGSSSADSSSSSQGKSSSLRASSTQSSSSSSSSPSSSLPSSSSSSSLRASSPPSSSSSSSPTQSGNPLTSPGNPATVTFKSNGGSRFAPGSSPPSHVQSGSWEITDGALPSVNPCPRFQQLSHMSKGIKAAFDMVQGWKVIQKLHASSAEGALLAVGGAGNWVLLSVKATKFFAKGLKMSQKVLTSKPFNNLILKGGFNGGMIEKLVRDDLISLANGFNAFYAAIKVAQFSRSLGKQSQEWQLPHANFIWKGYKFSKSLVSILDAVAGKNGWALTYMGKGFVIVKKVIGGIGVMVKAVFLSKELGGVVLKRVAISGGTFAAVLGTCCHTRKGKMPMEMNPKSKSKRPLCMTNEAYVLDWVLASSHSQFFKNESLFSWILLFNLCMEDFENVHINFSEEDDLRSILCLALPIKTHEFPVSA